MSGIGPIGDAGLPGPDWVPHGVENPLCGAQGPSSVVSPLNAPTADLVIEVSERELRRVHDAMQAMLDASENLTALVRELAGPEPGPVPRHLLTMLLMGTGYHRAARDTLRRLFRARNAIRRERKKEGK